ncbi:MAG: hypothetical protein C4311_06400 [Chloroflexota bacterium]
MARSKQGKASGEHRRCTYIRADGSACRAWAVRGRERCAAHGGLREEEPGPELIDALILALAEKQAEFLACLDADDLPSDKAIRLFSILSQNASRLRRLLRDRRAISGEAAEGITSAIAQALDELSTELGLEL